MMPGQLCTFLCDYASVMAGSGASGLRIQKNIERMARHYGCRTLLELTPSTVKIQLYTADNAQRAFRSEVVAHSGISFSKIRKLSSLSWDNADNLTDYGSALQRFQQIRNEKPLDGRIVRALASAANASFCELFGGDFISMLLVFAATYAGFFLKQSLIQRKVNTYMTFLISSFAAAIIASAAYVFSLGDTPDVALGTSVLFLVPGIPYLNSVCDMLTGHHQLGMGRMVEATILTACLSLGFCGAIVIMKIA